MNQLTKQTITIDIDHEGSQYRMDFTGAKFLDVYRVLKKITNSFESGEIFQDGLTITDPNTGEPATEAECRALISACKEAIDSE